ncbi:inward rectifier potassium channel 2-like [Antedon mediterranea]|uniref:inward rectifier potassium channel 2-like n=1 Tax=Antedon mediterranea TaxID=105859 RepID=UPI003AF43667
MADTRFSSEGRNHIEAKNYRNHASSNHHQIIPIKKEETWKRLVEKNGHCNVTPSIRANLRRYAVDLFTTSVDMPWRYNLIMVILGFFLNWFLFGCIYYAIAFNRGDFDNLENQEWKPCFRNFKNWKSAFMFSIETQTTIGYGFRCPTEECGEAMFFLVFQTIWSNLLEAFIIGSFIAKFSRPKLRAKTIMFSKTACITMKDGRLIFQFRLGDLRKSPIVEGHIRLQMVKHHITKEGCYVPFHVFDINIGHEYGLDRIFLVWPIEIAHEINEESPLYEYSKETLLESDFEIIAILEGIVEATGTTTQVRTSYLPNEIEWGYDFKAVISEKNGVMDVNLDNFHRTLITNTSTLSAKQLCDSFVDSLDENVKHSDNQSETDNEECENKETRIGRKKLEIESSL